VVARGEIWWHEDPNLGPRPHLILSRNVVIPLLNKVIAVPTTRRARGIPTEVALDEDDGMPQPCVLTLDNVSAIRVSLCTERITTLGPDRLHEVCEALRRATSC
jgi:mRNA-degrading endonuclease toxin of MazEF toxin-antitoxin module